MSYFSSVYGFALICRGYSVIIVTQNFCHWHYYLFKFVKIYLMVILYICTLHISNFDCTAVTVMWMIWLID